MRSLKYIALMISMIVLVGCHATSSEMEVNTKRSISTNSPNLSSTASLKIPQSATPSAPVPSQSVKVSETPNLTPSRQPPSVAPLSHLTVQNIETIPFCENDEVAVPPPSALYLPGFIIYQDSGMQDVNIVGGYPIKNWKVPFQREGRKYILGISQTGKWLAYSDSGFFGDKDFLTSMPTVEIFSDQNREAEHVVDMNNFKPLVEEFQSSRIGGWRTSSSRIVGDQLIPMSIALVSDSTTNQNTEVIYGLLNPFNGNWVNDSYATLPGWNPNYYVAFSPDMERALYTSKTKNQIILWDVKNKEILWQKTNLNLFPSDNDYKWSSDGSKAAYVISVEDGINSISRDGTEIPIRQIHDQSSYKYFLSDFQLSSDGNLVAMSYRLYDSTSDIEKWLLFVYDFRTQSYIFQCPISLIENNVIWSPDNRFLTGGTRYLELSQTSSPLRIFDIQDKIVYQLVDNGNAVDWVDHLEFISQ